MDSVMLSEFASTYSTNSPAAEFLDLVTRPLVQEYETGLQDKMAAQKQTRACSSESSRSSIFSVATSQLALKRGEKQV